MYQSLTVCRRFFRLRTFLYDLSDFPRKKKRVTCRCSLNIERPDNRRRTARIVSDLTDCNYYDFKGFLTLTFSENVTDPKYASHCLDVFFKRLTRAIGRPLKYLGVLEYQKRGAIHYHFLVDFDFIDFNRLHAMWSWGSFVNFRRITSWGDSLIGYLAKYIRKSDVSPFGFRRVFSSRSLVRPLQFSDSLAGSIIDFLDGLWTTVFISSFELPKSSNICTFSLNVLHQDLFDFLSLSFFSQKVYDDNKVVQVSPPTYLIETQKKQLCQQKLTLRVSY